jgi:hypothetical protein
LATVNNICLNVRQGAPPPLGKNPTAKQVTAYAAAAEAAARRTAVSFSNLHAPTTELIHLRQLYGDYQRMESLYAAVLSRLKGTRPTAFVDEFATQERKAAVDALANHLPACDPHAGTGGTLRPS